MCSYGVPLPFFRAQGFFPSESQIFFGSIFLYAVGKICSDFFEGVNVLLTIFCASDTFQSHQRFGKTDQKKKSKKEKLKKRTTHCFLDNYYKNKEGL
mmetsp:Transcript_22125/g.57085  ORF Transcript_22125/g.57085 Transcript_22125/m.57085 type:complete len:97 (+) Transcript_22125:823-1113(+)